jgi:hypothetical protein
LIEQPGSEITWDDRFPDPDNPTQSRQIDISIKREGTLTLIECRIHKNPQDVKWIEELIGRRISLKADAIIAVSYSGFTRGAILKAKRYGIILRDFKTLTEEEILQWGHKTRVWVSYHEFSNIDFSFLFRENARAVITGQKIFNYLSKRENFFKILEPIVREIDKKNPKQNGNNKIPLYVQLFPKDEKIEGFPISEVIFRSDYRILKVEGQIPSVVAYDGPEIDALERVAFVEDVDLGDFEITQSSNVVSVALDFNKIGMPLNSRLKDMQFDFKRPVRMSRIEILALPKLFIPIKNLSFEILFKD